MAAFEYRQAQEIRDAFKRHQVKYLFIGKSVEKNAANCERLVKDLRDLGFPLTDPQAQEVRRGNVLIQLKNGTFDLDLIFAPDGIERFEDAWTHRVDVEGFPVCDIDDIVRSKQATNRQKDKESLPRLLSFRDWLKRQK